METYRERKQSIYRIYAKSYDDARCLMLGDQALTARMTRVAHSPHPPTLRPIWRRTSSRLSRKYTGRL
jgi:hypothetical protein